MDITKWFADYLGTLFSEFCDELLLVLLQYDISIIYQLKKIQ